MQNQFEASKYVNIEERLDQARIKTWEAVDRIAAQYKPGIDEKEAIRIAQRTLAEMGSRKFWHKCHVRFGEGTTKSFNDPYTDNILKPDDIFYIDLGPIWESIEGDAGRTFVVGDNPIYKKAEKDVRTLFDLVSHHWRAHGISGKELYKFAGEEAEKLGWVLAPSYVRGHRLSEFPHSLYTEATLEELDFRPASKRWVLEVHICDPTMKFGAFYEDILT
ncbi:MAG: M24 family metallopeptidase [Oligoflexales bacterium]